MPSHDLTNWKQNLKIRYFGEFIGSSLKKWDDNQVDNNGIRTGTPVNYWNLFNFNYKILPRTSFIISPRFYLQVGDRNDLRKNEDPHVIQWDDTAFGLNQDFYKSPKFIYQGRLTHRQPTSAASQEALIDSQIEYQNDLTFLPTPSISILFWNTFRYYAYEAAKNEERYRINFTTLYNFMLSDKWKMQLMHELDMQHRNVKYAVPKKNLKEKDWNYFNKNKHTLAFGIGYSPSRALTVMPFVKALNDQDIRPETMQFGLWILSSLYN